jgi:hypothetical protein
MKHEYKEGKEARENFDKAMKRLFVAPKTVSMSQKKKRKPKASASDHASNASPKED